MTVVVTFGRVRLFFYVLHIYVGTATFLVSNGGVTPTTAYPDWYGLGLAGVYALWLVIVAALYPCAVRLRR